MGRFTDLLLGVCALDGKRSHELGVHFRTSSGNAASNHFDNDDCDIRAGFSRRLELGLEFGISNNYKGFDTSAPSWVTAAMSAILEAMKIDHPAWNWFDIKAALRQTASNWTSGWSASQFGYGAVDYDSATALGSTDSLYLQPPILRASANGTQIAVTLYPFRSSRRHHEVVYIVPASYVFPLSNELTAADIANLVAVGGQLVFSGNATDMMPSSVAAFAPPAPGSYTLVASTTDNAGAYSRVEAWSRQTVVVAGPPLVQDAYQQDECNNCLVATYERPQSVGNLNLVVVSWVGALGNVTSVTDTMNHAYVRAVGPTVLSTYLTQSIYYAVNPTTSDARNSVAVSFDRYVAAPDIRIAEYAGVTTASPFDGAVANTGISANSASGSLTTTHGGDILIAANNVGSPAAGPGAGYSQRMLTPNFGDILEDRQVYSPGAYTAESPLVNADAWIMQLAAFKTWDRLNGSFIQGAYQQNQCAGHCVMSTYQQAQTTGNLNVVVVTWGDITTHLTSVTDSLGNTYHLAIGPTTVPGTTTQVPNTQAIYYAVNSTDAPAGANTVVVSFNGSPATPDIRIAEYPGVDTSAPFDGAAASTGNGALSSSGSLTTTHANDLLIAANSCDMLTAGPGPGYTQDQLTPNYLEILEHQIVSSPGNYAATAPLQDGSPWIMQLVAFKLASR